MSQQIVVKFDNNLKKPEVRIPLTETTPDEVGEENYHGNKSDKQQTLVYGILTPLIMINNIVIDFTDVNSFILKSEGPVPTLDIDVNDRCGLTSTLDTPGLDNTIVVHILPPFDNAYKKIKLLFYISNMNISGNKIKMTGIYKVPGLICDNISSFGKIDTYKLFEQIAIKTQLGFASNCESSNNDERYIYCDNISYLEMMNREIKRANSDETHVYNYWIDYWDTLNFVDIYKRYNDSDSGEDMEIWINNNVGETNAGIEIKPIKVRAELSNHPETAQSDVGIIKKEVINKSGNNISSGTDKVYSIYKENNKEYMDYLIQDGDVKEDILKKLYYLGEVYGEYDYLLPEACYSSYMQKLNAEVIRVTLRGPNLGMIRGRKVDVLWYINDDRWKDKVENASKMGAINKYDEIEIPNIASQDTANNKYSNSTNDGAWILDKAVSGQYTIIGCSINYIMGQWKYILTLVRPHTDKPEIIKKESK